MFSHDSALWNITVIVHAWMRPNFHLYGCADFKFRRDSAWPHWCKIPSVCILFSIIILVKSPPPTLFFSLGSGRDLPAADGFTGRLATPLIHWLLHLSACEYSVELLEQSAAEGWGFSDKGTKDCPSYSKGSNWDLLHNFKDVSF